MLEANLKDMKKTIEQIEQYQNEGIERTKEQRKFEKNTELLELKEAHLKEIKQLQDEYMQKMKQYFNNNHSEK